MGVFSRVSKVLGRLFGAPADEPVAVDFPLELAQSPADISSVGLDGLEELIAAASDVESKGQKSPYFEVLRQAAHDGLTFDVPIVMGLEGCPPEDRILRAQIVGFQHDVIDADGTRAAITCIARHAMPAAYEMNESHSNDGGWRTSRMRRFHTRFLLGLFPKHLRRAIRPVRKLSACGVSPDGKPVLETTVDSLWLPSACEMLGTRLKGSGAPWERDEWARVTLPCEGEQLPYFHDLGVTWGSWEQGCEQAVAVLANRNLTNGGARATGSTEPELLWLRTACGANDYSFLCLDSHGRVRERGAKAALSLCVGFSL